MNKFYTAHEMAMMSHNLSKDGMTARLANGEVYRWGSFKWVGPMIPMASDPKRPRKSRRAH